MYINTSSISTERRDEEWDEAEKHAKEMRMQRRTLGVSLKENKSSKVIRDFLLLFAWWMDVKSLCACWHSSLWFRCEFEWNRLMMKMQLASTGLVKPTVWWLRIWWLRCQTSMDHANAETFTCAGQSASVRSSMNRWAHLLMPSHSSFVLWIMQFQKHLRYGRTGILWNNRHDFCLNTNVHWLTVAKA